MDMDCQDILDAPSEIPDWDKRFEVWRRWYVENPKADALDVVLVLRLCAYGSWTQIRESLMQSDFEQLSEESKEQLQEAVKRACEHVEVDIVTRLFKDDPTERFLE